MSREVVADGEHLRLFTFESYFRFCTGGVGTGDSGERDVNDGDVDDGEHGEDEDLCTGLSLPVWGGEGEAIVCASVKGENLQKKNSLSNCSIKLPPRHNLP